MADSEEFRQKRLKHEEQMSRMFDEVMGLGDFADSSRGSNTSGKSGGQDGAPEELKAAYKTSSQPEEQPVEEEDSSNSRQEEKTNETVGKHDFPRIASGGGGGSGSAAFDDAVDGLPPDDREEEDEDWHFALPLGSLEDNDVSKANRKKIEAAQDKSGTRGKEREEEEHEKEGSNGSANTSHSSQNHTPENSQETDVGATNQAEDTEDSQQGETSEAAPTEDSNPRKSPPVNIKDEPIDDGYDAALLPQSSIRQIKEELEQEEELRISSVYSVGGGNTFVPPTIPAATIQASHQTAIFIPSRGTVLQAVTPLNLRPPVPVPTSISALSPIPPRLPPPPPTVPGSVRCSGCSKVVSAGESEGGDTSVEMSEEELDEEEIDDLSFSPGEEEWSEDEEPEPVFRKRPRLPVVDEPPASPSQSLQPSDVVTVSDHPDLWEGHETGKDGTVWKRIPPGLSHGSPESHCILTQVAGPTAHASCTIYDHLSAFMCLVDLDMLQHICNCTVAEAHRSGAEDWELSLSELKAFIALLLARGVHKRRDAGMEYLWSSEWGVPFFTTTMSRNRYRDIMRFLRFDQTDTRHTQLSEDHFALVSDVWDRLIQNSIACYEPGAEITVGKQLYPTKSRCPFTQYMPDKPEKVGIKFWLLADVETKYMLNGFPDLGKEESCPAAQCLGENVVLKLTEPFVGKGRNVTADNFFTSLPLAEKLFAKNTSLVGMVNKNKRSLPPSVHLETALHETQVLQSDIATLTLYQGRARKMCILSTLHSSVEVCDDANKRPETVHYYKKTKGGVDFLVKMLNQYSARAATRRWPVAVFYNLLDMATLNACILYRRCMDAKTTRRLFILELCKQLRSEHVGPSLAQAPVQAVKEEPAPNIPEEKRRRRKCTVRRKCTQNQTTKTCMRCCRAVCGQCTAKTYIVCADCE